MATPQTEEEALAGLLLVTIDGQRLEIPILKMAAARRWRRLLNETISSLADLLADSPMGNEAMVEAELELVLAYDETGALGGRDWLEAHATDADLDELYNAVVAKSFRFTSSPTALVLAILQQVAASRRANSTNGPLPTGTSTPASSTPGSPSPSSISSGREAKRGSNVSAAPA